jgi:perosamine synthetase
MEAIKPDRFIPDLPTLWPSMLWARRRTPRLPPFDRADAKYFYFARNAVWLTAKLFGLSGGEVLVPAYHHGVEIEALVDAGVNPRFYRVGRRWDVDLDDVAKKIGPDTRAIYLVHYAGFPGPAAELRQLADEHGLPLIEDCALSLLSSDGGQPLGAHGNAAIYCLYKTLPVPNGGALVLNGRRYSIPDPPEPPRSSVASHVASALLKNAELRAGGMGRALRGALRAVGRSTASAARIERVATGTQHFDRNHVDLGMSPLTLHIAARQDLQGIVDARRRNYFFLLGRLRDLAPPLMHELPAGVCPLFFPLVVEDKGELMARLLARGIHTVDFWRYFHPLCAAEEFPEVAQLRRTVLEIPCHQDLDAERMSGMAAEVRAALIEVGQRTPRRARG